MGFVRILFGRVIPIIVVAAAIFVGWLSTAPLAWGKFFATVMPLTAGRLPPTIVGHGRMEGTPPVPDDMMPQPRPLNEMFQTLPGGYKMPMCGLGMCCRYSAYDDVLVRRTVLWYLLLGGRHIDGAHLYLNHKAIGLGIRDAISRGVPREEVFLTTKIFPSHYGYNKVLETVPTYLEELGLDYIDMVLMHAPKMPLIRNDCTKAGLSDTECRQETWRALSELREKGVMRNIGVSNFAMGHMKEIEELGLAPIADHQFQWNTFSPPEIQKTFDYCRQKNITVTAYYSLGGSLQHAQAATVDTLEQLAAKYDKSVAQLMLRWSMQKGAVVIPGTGNPDHMKENLEVYAFQISPLDMEAIDELKNTEAASKFSVIDPEKMDSIGFSDVVDHITDN
mmetsp:Transcript_30585/g.61976  ORF Transcript_30585/g.61976 Transcript_30585/m.61976 type:complete len:392 (-) Transcript_30585:57-1232(-)